MQPAASFIAEAWAELAIGICFVGLRLYFRYSQVGLRGMSLDDFLMILAGVHWIHILSPSCGRLLTCTGVLYHRDAVCALDRRGLEGRREQQLPTRSTREVGAGPGGVAVCCVWLERTYRRMVHVHWHDLDAQVLLDDLLLSHDVRSESESML
jgi:hypothetical protein